MLFSAFPLLEQVRVFRDLSFAIRLSLAALSSSDSALSSTPFPFRQSKRNFLGDFFLC